MAHLEVYEVSKSISRPNTPRPFGLYSRAFLFSEVDCILKSTTMHIFQTLALALGLTTTALSITIDTGVEMDNTLSSETMRPVRCKSSHFTPSEIEALY